MTGRPTTIACRLADVALVTTKLWQHLKARWKEGGVRDDNAFFLNMVIVGSGSRRWASCEIILRHKGHAQATVCALSTTAIRTVRTSRTVRHHRLPRYLRRL